MNYFQSSGGMLNLAPVPTLQAAPSLNDSLRFINDGLVGPIVEGLRQAATNFVDSMGLNSHALRTSGVLRAPQRKSSRLQDCCDDTPDPCHCNCCIVDADLVINARVGERRVVPITIENHWRRERPITLDLSAFSSRGGTPSQVTGQLGEPAPTFTIPPCGQQTILLTVDATGDANQRLPVDVDNCVVSYADLRVEGCEIRPIRIAVALLPRDCGDYRITCSCQCC